MPDLLYKRSVTYRNIMNTIETCNCSGRKNSIFISSLEEHFTDDEHPCRWWDSNPQSQQASGHRSTPQNARPLGPAISQTMPTFNLTDAEQNSDNVAFFVFVDLTFKHHTSYILDKRTAPPHSTLFIYLVNKYI
jgi:hypothetical protein